MNQANQAWNELMRLLCECGDADLVGTRDALLALRKMQASKISKPQGLRIYKRKARVFRKKKQK